MASNHSRLRAFLEEKPLLPGVFWPEQMQVFTSTPCYNEQGIVLHGKANGVQDYQYLYLPSSIMSQVQWNYETQWSLLVRYRRQ